MKTTSKNRKYFIAKILAAGNTTGMHDTNFSHEDYSTCFNEALKMLRKSQFILSVIIYSNKGTVININRENPSFKNISNKTA